jgi:hypothetical protein
MLSGILFCLFGVLFGTFLVVARPQSRPIVTDVQNTYFGCPAKLHGDRGLQGALQRYRYREGHYPDRLLDLYPTYVSGTEAFHCPADPSRSDTVSYIYRRPAPDAPADTIVIICDHHHLPGAHVRLLTPIEGHWRMEVEQMVPRRAEP